MSCAPRITTPLSASVPIHARAGAKGTVFPVHPGNSGRPSWGLWPGSAVTFSGHTVTQCSGGDGGQCSVTSLHGISLTVMTLTVVTFHHCLKYCAPCSLCSPPPCPPRSGGLSPAEHGEHRIKGTQGAGHRTQRTQDTGNRGHRTLNMGHGTQDKGNRGHGTQGTRDTEDTTWDTGPQGTGNNTGHGTQNTGHGHREHRTQNTGDTGHREHRTQGTQEHRTEDARNSEHRHRQERDSRGHQTRTLLPGDGAPESGSLSNSY